ncbi:Hypothetical protein NocV09_01800180 [Nannochloropsis oceanica]
MLVFFRLPSGRSIVLDVERNVLVNGDVRQHIYDKSRILRPQGVLAKPMHCSSSPSFPSSFIVQGERYESGAKTKNRRPHEDIKTPGTHHHKLIAAKTKYACLSDTQTVQ